MYLELWMFMAGFIGSLAGFFTGKFTLTRRVLQLEMRQDDLEERHVTNARKAAARARWGSEEQLDLQIESAIGQVKQPEKKRWTKWGSSRNSSSEKSLEA